MIKTKRKSRRLDAIVARDICREIIKENGPQTVSELYYQIKRVFRVNSAYLVTTLTTSNGGFVIDNGVVKHRAKKGK